MAIYGQACMEACLADGETTNPDAIDLLKIIKMVFALVPV